MRAMFSRRSSATLRRSSRNESSHACFSSAVLQYRTYLPRMSGKRRTVHRKPFALVVVVDFERVLDRRAAALELAVVQVDDGEQLGGNLALDLKRALPCMSVRDMRRPQTRSDFWQYTRTLSNRKQCRVWLLLPEICGDPSHHHRIACAVAPSARRPRV